ncbi:hypothetical protein C0991_009763 [Blastosporella zonata]|nr:hypothetical protein C0991_009763 [Blastosporella zonata]
MDNRNPLAELFSRGSTPPAQQQQQQQQQQQPQPVSNNSSPSQIDSLFQHLTVDRQQQSGSDNYGSSASVTSLLSLTDEPISSAASNASPTNFDRQSALVSLLSGGSASVNRSVPLQAPAPAPAPPAPAPPAQQQQVQQIPTPPGSSQRSGSGSTPTHNEAQGKFLLEQLMAGNPPRSNYVDPQPSHTAPSPPYAPSLRDGEYHPYTQAEMSPEVTQRTQVHQQVPPPPQQQQQLQPVLPLQSQQQQQQMPQQPSPQQQQQQTPSPRKSMFEFVSPFDHLSNSTTSVKKKPVPPQPQSISSVNDDSGSWTAVSDPKRQSVENLLSRAQLPPQHQAPPGGHEPFDFSHVDSLSSRVPPPPLPPKPAAARVPSPPLRASPPPKTHVQRSQGRNAESPAGTQGGGSGSQAGGGRRDKEGSPVPRGNGRAKGPSAQSKLPKNQPSPPPPAHTIFFDVSKSLHEIQASPEEVKSTAIALVKQDSTFLPGSTIGATHWVAYTMTRGRVRVISRSSGFRTLLQLDPSIFSHSSSITDMAVHGDRLAAVTSEGGFIVWQLPETITDDVPGEVLLCVHPSVDGIHAVKWHPKDFNTLAVASDNSLYLIDLVTVHSHYRGQPISLAALTHITQTFTVSSRLVAFDFDVMHYALATITADSTLTIWNMYDQLPFSTHTVRGDDIPSSLTFVDGGFVVGRKNGTVFQLVSHTTKQALSTVKFIGDADMFGHASYDSRIQTLWVANNRRESIIAIRINLESTIVNGEEAIRGGFDQIVEFSGPKSSVHFVILTAEADLNGKETNAACVAAKITLGDLALLAFNVHTTGVDQILIRKEWFESALAVTPRKLPIEDVVPTQASIEVKAQRQASQALSVAPSRPAQSGHQRARSPASEDGDFNQDDQKGKGKGPKSVNWKEKEEQQAKDKNGRSDVSIINESSLGQALTREIKKTEESLHTRIGRLIGKEMDKQHQRMDDARAHEQAEDFARQEKILKLISTELTRNTTRVVEMAVKSEVQNSVLPSLENITKNEVKAALDDQIGRGLVDFISQSLPNELEKMIFRPDVSAHFAHILTANLTPVLSSHVHDAMSKTFAPLFNQNLNRMHQELSQELRHEVHNLKAELMSWQRDLFRNQESSIRELERTVGTLSDHVKFLGLNVSAPHHSLQQQSHTRNSPNANIPPVQGGLNQIHPRQQNAPVVPPPPASYGHNLGGLQQQLPPKQVQQAPLPPAPVHQTWYSSTIAAPQASHPATIPQPLPPPPPQQQVLPPQQQQQQQPEPISTPDANDTWESIFLPAVLSEDLRDLQRLLLRTNADIVMPMDRPGPLSQPVILTAMHRLAAIVCATPPNDESFKSAMWWLQRGIKVLDPKEQIVMDYLPNVVPGIYTHLNMTKQRLGLPGGPPSLEKARASVNDALEMLRRKGLQSYEGMDVPKK